MVKHKRFNGLEAILVPNLRFVQTTLGNDAAMISTMEKMLSKLKYHNGDFEGAISSATRALTLIARDSLITTESIEIVEILVDTLKHIVSRYVVGKGILEAAILV